MRRSDMMNLNKIQAWSGRTLLYSGADVPGKKLLTEALRNDPDNSDAQKALKNYKQALLMKEKAGEIFKAADYEKAIEMFNQCLEIDPLNLSYNSIIYLNKSIALSKISKHEESKACLNKAIKMNPSYAKALVKRAEMHSALGDHEDAVRDLAKAAEIDSTGNGVQQKLKIAQ